jgi:hypothetical protein
MELLESSKVSVHACPIDVDITEYRLSLAGAKDGVDLCSAYARQKDKKEKDLHQLLLQSKFLSGN